MPSIVNMSAAFILSQVAGMAFMLLHIFML